MNGTAKGKGLPLIIEQSLFNRALSLSRYYQWESPWLPSPSPGRALSFSLHDKTFSRLPVTDGGRVAYSASLERREPPRNCQ